MTVLTQNASIAARERYLSRARELEKYLLKPVPERDEADLALGWNAWVAIRLLKRAIKSEVSV